MCDDTNMLDLFLVLSETTRLICAPQVGLVLFFFCGSPPRRTGCNSRHIPICEKKEGLTVADSNITKRALASALKELMEQIPFEKISVAMICEKCGMNRKSFYYHFRDKFDLVNWIFDTDFISLSVKRPEDRWEFLELLCSYFYENRNFYRRALRVKGQNSFSEHFREFLHPLLRVRIEAIIGCETVPSLCVDFFSDGIVCSIERWLLDKNCMSPEQLVATMKNIVQRAAVEICRNMEETE